MDFREEDTTPLLKGEEGLLLNPDTLPKWPGPWNVQSGNPFNFEDWKPLVDWLFNGEKARSIFTDAGLLLNNPINVTPIAKPKKSADSFGVNVEPHLEPSHAHTLDPCFYSIAKPCTGGPIVFMV